MIRYTLERQQSGHINTNVDIYNFSSYKIIYSIELSKQIPKKPNKHEQMIINKKNYKQIACKKPHVTPYINYYKIVVNNILFITICKLNISQSNDMICDEPFLLLQDF